MTQTLKAKKYGKIACYLLWAGAALASLDLAMAQPAARKQTVLVTLTTRGIYLSQTTLRPGKVRFLVVNRTPRPGLLVLVSPAANENGKLDHTSAVQPSNTRGGQRPLMDMALGAGTYTLWLSDVPGASATLSVIPGGAQ